MASPHEQAKVGHSYQARALSSFGQFKEVVDQVRGSCAPAHEDDKGGRGCGSAGCCFFVYGRCV